MDEKKIAFIIVSNNAILLNESIEYLNRLLIPADYAIELLVIKEAKSMLLGMEEGKASTDAKYKVFMHQDVFIINPYFLQDIITIFQSDKKIGLIGMVGAPHISQNGVMWNAQRVGHLYNNEAVNVSSIAKPYDIRDGLLDVEALDGLMMISAYDIPLRTDLFDGWDFYDVSTSMEYLRAGYRVIVPTQKRPWVIHDDGRFVSLWNYDKYRHIALEEYTDFFKNKE